MVQNPPSEPRPWMLEQLDAGRNQPPGSFVVTITIVPATGNPRDLEGTRLRMDRVGAAKLTTLNYLNQRGQALFTGIEPGEYSLRLPGSLRIQSTVTMAANDQESDMAYSESFWNASHTLESTLTGLRSGEWRVNFKALDKKLDLAVLKFSWILSTGYTAGEIQTVYAVLHWNDERGSCTTGLNLGLYSGEGTEFDTPEAPSPLGELTTEPAEVLQRSIGLAATAADRVAWRQLLNLQDPALTPEVRAAIEAGLAQANSWQSIEMFIRNLKESNAVGERSSAVEALGHEDNLSAVKALVEALQQDTALEVREAAAEALGNLKTQLALAALRQAQQDSATSEKLRQLITQILEEQEEV